MIHCEGCGKNWYDILLGISNEGTPRNSKFVTSRIRMVTSWDYHKHAYYKNNGDIYDCPKEVEK